jgi:hypothetical protein
MTSRDFRSCPRRLLSIFSRSRPQNTAATVINIFLWKPPELEPGANPVAE